MYNMYNKKAEKSNVDVPPAIALSICGGAVAAMDDGRARRCITGGA